MLTYQLKKTPGVPLYEALYRCIRADILSGVLAPGEKLPSKRALCANLEVSKITVEGAYNQLLEEGYIRAREKVGYFVEDVDRGQPAAPVIKAEAPSPAAGIDLTGRGSVRFPFSVWSRLQREVMLDYGEQLLLPLPNQGLPELRQAIARHLAEFRGLHADPDCIVIGAGSDYLYMLLVQLLGRDMTYAVEEPGYSKIRRIYAAGGAQCVSAQMDREGVLPDGLGNARVLHLSPSHHFPTGIVTPLSRRQALLRWARECGGWIIEDDYDSEFRFAAHPLPTLCAMDPDGRVIYMNTFSKTLAPSIRISYMVLPPQLMAAYRTQLGFYSCTVPSFEQYTLARFLSRGQFEKHLNRMRKFYKARRNQVLEAVSRSPLASRLTILEENAGLHFLVRVDTALSGSQLVQRCAAAGLQLRSLESYYHGSIPAWAERCLVVNYAALSDEDVQALTQLLQTPHTFL